MGIYEQYVSCANSYLWYLDRLDEQTWEERDGTYNMCPIADNTTAYVIDMAVWGSHNELAGRLAQSWECAVIAPNGQCQTGSTNGCAGVSGWSEQWHGTAVAALLTGKQMGAARPQIVSMKIFPCGPNAVSQVSYAMNALNTIAATRVAGRPAVVNHSGYFLPWDSNNATYANAVHNFVQSYQIPFFTSADNWSTDACNFSPNQIAYTPGRPWGTAFVVAASRQRSGLPGDWHWQEYDPTGNALVGLESGSNLGGCVSAYAPGGDVYAPRHASSGSTLDANAYDWESGTSFASPLVAGLALRWMDIQKQQTGGVPTSQAVYQQLFNWRAPTSVQGASTPRPYSVCYESGSNPGAWFLKTDPRPCNEQRAGWVEYTLPAATNTSDARMIVWPSTCP